MKGSHPWLVPHFPQPTVENVPDDLVPRLGIGRHDVLEPTFPLEEADRAQEERLREAELTIFGQDSKAEFGRG